MTTKALLVVKELYLNFKVFGGELKVLDNVNLQLNPGELVGLVGETGCGKSTLVRLIMRIISMPPAVVIKGEILFKGKDILKMNSFDLLELRRKNISIIFQDPNASLNPVLTIGTQLYDAIKYNYQFKSNDNNDKLSKNKKKIIKENQKRLLKEVFLPDPEHMLASYPVQLSGGMKQRISIAMSLVANKEILLADEVGTSLDVTIKEQILNLIRSLVEKRKMSSILISHSLGSIKNITDRVYVMYAGTIVESAPTKVFFSNPLHPYCQGLVNAVPKLSGGGFNKGIPGNIPDYFNPPSGCRFHPRCPHAMKICESKISPPINVDKEHEVACHLYYKQ